MTQIPALDNNIQVEQAFTVEEWAPTPERVQVFVLSLLHRLQALESEVAALKEQVNPRVRIHHSRPHQIVWTSQNQKSLMVKTAGTRTVNLVIRSMSDR